VPDPDRPDPEIIDFSPHPARTRRPIAIAIAAAVAIAVAAAAVVVFVVIKPGAPAAGHPGPALARLIAQVTNVPVRVSDAAGDGADRVIAKPAPVAGPPLTAHGKPEVLYVATEYCPYCATQSWAMIVALSRFGTFSGLRTIRSGVFNSDLIPVVTDQTFPPLDTWTFYGSGYTSKYLTFVPVETRSNVLVSRHANPLEKNSYTALQRLTPAQQAIFAKYDNLRAVPFADFGNRYALTGSSFDPGVLEHETWSQIAAELRNPHGIRGRSILGTVNYITAAICQLTHDQPATACTPAVRSLLPGS
jgi:Domain of unknown function (DUF929)